MTRWPESKIRSEETWARVRRAWEAGETGASLARRYDVGLANLWRRRASEGWERVVVDDPDPEPVEGWVAYAEARRDGFDAELASTRALALALVEGLQGGSLEDAPIWHLGFLYRMRAERLGPEVARLDREAARGKPFAEAFWHADGRLRKQAYLDQVLLRLNRDIWREEIGLPEGAAPLCP